MGHAGADGSIVFAFQRPPKWHIKKGDSIAVNGICSTVSGLTRTSFAVEYMPETVHKTTVAQWQRGMGVNLESSLRYGDTLGGHLVMGHIDCVGIVRQVGRQGRSRAVRIAIPRKFSRYIAPKGSVAIDGVSLTVVRAGRGLFSVALVDYTRRHTTLGFLREGMAANIECDIVGKYLEQLAA